MMIPKVKIGTRRNVGGGVLITGSIIASIQTGTYPHRCIQDISIIHQQFQNRCDEPKTEETTRSSQLRQVATRGRVRYEQLEKLFGSLVELFRGILM